MIPNDTYSIFWTHFRVIKQNWLAKQNLALQIFNRVYAPIWYIFLILIIQWVNSFALDVVFFIFDTWIPTISHCLRHKRWNSSIHNFNYDCRWQKWRKKSLVKFWQFFLWKRGFLRNLFLIFLVISQELYDLQRCTIPYSNCLKELITPLLQCDCFKIGHFWDIRRNIFPNFFYPYFISNRVDFLACSWNQGLPSVQTIFDFEVGCVSAALLISTDDSTEAFLESVLDPAKTFKILSLGDIWMLH